MVPWYEIMTIQAPFSGALKTESYRLIQKLLHSL
jgi:hypothetical protein